MPSKGQRRDHTGRKYFLLTAIEYSQSSKNGNSWWWFLCDCGNGKLANVSKVKCGEVKSCGCLLKQAGERTRKHGHCSVTESRYLQHSTKEYRAWINLRRRCCDPKTASYPNYGGRGIQVCPEWMDDFEKFLDDVGPAPSSKHSIGRIDNDGNYEPENVRWETAKQQANNKRPPSKTRNQ